MGGSDDTSAVLLCSGMLSDDSDVLSKTLSVMELFSFEDDISEELVLVELWLVVLVVDDVDVEELLELP